MAEVNRILARGFVEGINRGRMDPELFAPDFVYHDPFGQTTDFEGADQFLAMFVAGFPDLNVAIEDEVAEGDRVVVRWTSRGTHRGEFMGMPPSGNEFAIGGLTLLRIARGEDRRALGRWRLPRADAAGRRAPRAGRANVNAGCEERRTDAAVGDRSRRHS